MLNKLLRQTPLALLQLMKEKIRFTIAVAGIAFADILMFFQLGMLDALFDGSVKCYQLLQGDLVLVNSQFQTLYLVKEFPRERLEQTRSIEGVKSVSSVYIGFAQWRNPQTRLNRTILVWGIDPVESPFALPEINPNQSQLILLNRVLFDQGSRTEYGQIPDLLKQKSPVEIQINDKTMDVVGLFNIGASFVTDGNVITSDSTFLNLFPEHQADQIALGLIKLKPGADVQQIQAQITANLPNDVKVLTPSQLAQNEIDYLADQGVGFVFGLGVMVGFIVGIVIVYQILYADVSDHLPEYATMKAMGYSDRYLLGVLIQASLLLAILGYIPGFFFSIGLYQLGYSATQLPIMMKVSRAVMVLILTIIMCAVSGAIAMNKLRSADPADIF
ncbi:MAG: FtsX-like permease family protein [Microcystis aeruginosa L111-01]|jgi:putative ABC transport system permease protein|nr:FtsX-like permease family protein [Microcystis aeruginosa W13-16]NCQ72489.1 FtsX-like permease family protein [Microcystis aeruginosa W13-13]NCQ76934.1 FtsX-like permease family protein [Microcystis aeruginosa W13-15]NCR20432.1 FtsX-like permease family protein [Microcystis aeruginosa L111-01]NCS42315.1 FtsX-like permease family protein [Microcystis aeruginosa BS11-05]